MAVIYNLINILFIAIYLPIFFFKKKMHKGFSMRLGFLPKGFTFYSPIWIHAVSVGEIANMRQLFAGLAGAFPGKQFVFSTVTPTGNKIALSIARKHDAVIYLPLDLSWIVNSVLGRIKPSLFVIAETEFWPNMICALYSRKVPVIIVNGRISDRSVAGYGSIRWLIAPILRKVTLFCMQTQADAQRIISLGADPGAVKVTGNMKFDQRAAVSPEHRDQLKSQMNIRPEEKLLVAGSTHPGEEDQVVSAYTKIISQYPFVRLMIAPRHPERAAELEKTIRRYGLEPVRISGLKTSAPPGRCVFILDAIGVLVSYYSVADVVFVGGSLVKHGGQNFLEPAFLGKPVILGPYLFNFRDIARQFLDQRAAIMVRSADELSMAVSTLLTDKTQAGALVQRSQELIRRNQGATERNAAYIKEYALMKKSDTIGLKGGI
jgi:3-deoxy-D-manno-octulosonic-acid transferase